MRAILFLIIGLNIMAVVGTGSEWEEHSVTIKWGESLSISDYNITAVDFRTGTVEEITNKTKCENEHDAYKRKVWRIILLLMEPNFIMKLHMKMMKVHSG